MSLLRPYCYLAGLLTPLLWAQASQALEFPRSSTINGIDVAHLLNQRYQDTKAACAGGDGAWVCSGVVVKPLHADLKRPFWHLTIDEATLLSAEFAYLRADLSTRSLSSGAGFVLKDGYTAQRDRQPYLVRCAFPVAVTPAANAAFHGCDLIGDATPTLPDPSSCGSYGIKDAAGWLEHFTIQGSHPNRQCSLSSRNAGQFKASLEAHEMLSPEMARQSNTVLVRAWDPATPEQLAVQALFYDVHLPGSLAEALKFQNQYHTAVGTWLPVMRMNLIAANGAPFTYEEKDQLPHGYAVAERLEARYANTARTCPDGSAAYRCTGVLARGIRDLTLRDFWNPVEKDLERNGVSFIYLRADVGNTRLPNANGSGLIMRELGVATEAPLTLRCAFPSNADTDGRDFSCHSVLFPQSCAEGAIHTIEEWVPHYVRYKNWGQCHFDPDATSFQMSIDVRAHFPEPSERLAWNEIIIAPWPRDIPTQLPLETLWYTGAGLVDAQRLQQDFMKETGLFLPIMRVSMSENPVFSYAPDEQMGDLAPASTERHENTPEARNLAPGY
ncbi:hypothetical protein ACX3YG_29250 [Pseudomonas wadenswilerensis]